MGFSFPYSEDYKKFQEYCFNLTDNCLWFLEAINSIELFYKFDKLQKEYLELVRKLERQENFNNQ